MELVNSVPKISPEDFEEMVNSNMKARLFMSKVTVYCLSNTVEQTFVHFIWTLVGVFDFSTIQMFILLKPENTVDAIKLHFVRGVTATEEMHMHVGNGFNV
jgi:hypothetical protein